MMKRVMAAVAVVGTLGAFSISELGGSCGGGPALPAPPDCHAWCEHAREPTMNCPSGGYTQSGSSCEDVCANVMSGPAPFNLKCRVEATSCAQADMCER